MRILTVPLFPCGGGTLLDPISITGEILFPHGSYSHVMQPVVRECLKEELRGQESCIDVTVVCDAYLMLQSLHHTCSLSVGHAAHYQCVDVATIISIRAGFGIVIFLVKGISGAIGQGTVGLFVGLLVQDSCRTCCVIAAEP